jgi:type II secretory pathway pseudopilin PulG
VKHTRIDIANGRGFSMMEILLVIGILVILLALSVPAFRSLMRNSEQALAQNQLREGLMAARDAAMMSETGDAAAYFAFDRGRVRIIPVVSAGEFLDRRPDGILEIREIFVPIAGMEGVALPRGWSVRAHASAYTIHRENGTISNPPDQNGWYENFTDLADEGNWLFPETHFVSYDGTNVESRGYERHSFIVRFKGGTGELDVSNRRTALVLDPVPEYSFRNTPPFSDVKVLEAENPLVFARRVLERADVDKPVLLGDRSVDTVLVRPVTELSLFEESRMLAAIGARANRDTGTLYLPPDQTRRGAVYDPAGLPQGLDAAEAQRRINAWIQGHLDPDTDGVAVPSDAKVFVLERYLGQLQEVAP